MRELDRLAGHLADRERRAAARIAVGLRQDHAGERQRLVEGLGRVHGILAGHAVHHEQRLDRFQRRVHRAYFLHHRLIHVQATGAVHDQHVHHPFARLFHRRARDVHRFLVGTAREKFRVHGSGQFLQLLDRRRPINVGADHHDGFLFALAQQPRELGHGRGLAGALKPGHENHRRRTRRQIQPFIGRAHERDQLVVHDLDQRLPRGQARQYFLPGGPDAHVLDEILHHRQRHVGLEQRQTHLAQRLARVLFRQPPLPAQALEGDLQSLA